MPSEHDYWNPEPPSWSRLPAPDPRVTKGLHWAMVAVSGAALLLVILNFALNLNVRSIQGEVNQRQQFINQSVQLGRVDEALIRALAQVALKENNEQLHDLLTQNGVTINPTAAPNVPASAAPGVSSSPPAAAGPVSPGGSPATASPNAPGPAGR